MSSVSGTIMRTSKIVRSTVAAVCIAAVAMGAQAHHGWSGYDSDKPLASTA
jgi:hypothetical protein